MLPRKLIGGIFYTPRAWGWWKWPAHGRVNIKTRRKCSGTFNRWWCEDLIPSHTYETCGIDKNLTNPVFTIYCCITCLHHPSPYNKIQVSDFLLHIFTGVNMLYHYIICPWDGQGVCLVTWRTQVRFHVKVTSDLIHRNWYPTGWGNHGKKLVLFENRFTWTYSYIYSVTECSSQGGADFLREYFLLIFPNTFDH